MPLEHSHVVGPVEPPLVDLTIGQLLQRAANSAPDRVALVAGSAVYNDANTPQRALAALHMRRDEASERPPTPSA